MITQRKIIESSDLPAINKDVVGSILAKLGETDCSVISVRKKDNENGKGDHYLSEVVHFSIRVNGENSEKSCDFILKDMGTGLSDFITEVNGIEKEVSMYEVILPEINSLLEEAVTPKMFCRPDSKSIVLNDLSSDGYALADRLELLDYDHSKLALTYLAKLHAGSVRYSEMFPEKIVTAAEETVYNGNQDSIPYYFSRKNIRNAINMLSGLPEGHVYSESIEQFYDSFWKDITEAANADHDFKVLNHGDFWSTNILFRYVNQVPVECKLIDFQLTRFCSPTLDLYQFMTISVKASVIDDKFDDLLNDYVETLNKTLTELGSTERLWKKDLDSVLEKTKVFGILNALVLTPIALCHPADPLQLSDVKKSDFRQGFPRGDPYEKAFAQSRVQQHILFLLRFFRKKGFL